MRRGELIKMKSAKAIISIIISSSIYSLVWAAGGGGYIISEEMNRLMSKMELLLSHASERTLGVYGLEQFDDLKMKGIGIMTTEGRIIVSPVDANFLTPEEKRIFQDFSQQYDQAWVRANKPELVNARAQLASLMSRRSDLRRNLKILVEDTNRDPALFRNLLERERVAAEGVLSQRSLVSRLEAERIADEAKRLKAAKKTGSGGKGPLMCGLLFVGGRLVYECLPSRPGDGVGPAY